MRPTTTQSFLTDLHTLKEAIASGSDVKKSGTTGQLRTLYLHEKLADFAQDFFKGSQSKMQRHQSYQDSAKNHLVDTLKCAICNSIKIPNSTTLNSSTTVHVEQIYKLSKEKVTTYISTLEKNKPNTLQDDFTSELTPIPTHTKISTDLKGKESQSAIDVKGSDFEIIERKFSEIDTLVETVLPAASWIKENIGWEGDQAIKFARMMSNPELKNLPKKVQFEIAGKVLDLTRKFINSGSANGSEPGVAKTKAEIKIFQEEKLKLLADSANNPNLLTEAAAVRWIDNFHPETKPDQKTALAKKMLKINFNNFTAQNKYDLVSSDLALQVGPAKPEQNPNLN